MCPFDIALLINAFGAGCSFAEKARRAARGRLLGMWAAISG